MKRRPARPSTQRALDDFSQLAAIFLGDGGGRPLDHHAAHILCAGVADEDTAFIAQLPLHLRDRLVISGTCRVSVFFSR